MFSVVILDQKKSRRNCGTDCGIDEQNTHNEDVHISIFPQQTLSLINHFQILKLKRNVAYSIVALIYKNLKFWPGCRKKIIIKNRVHTYNVYWTINLFSCSYIYILTGGFDWYPQ